MRFPWHAKSTRSTPEEQIGIAISDFTPQAGLTEMKPTREKPQKPHHESRLSRWANRRLSRVRSPVDPAQQPAIIPLSPESLYLEFSQRCNLTSADRIAQWVAEHPKVLKTKDGSRSSSSASSSKSNTSVSSAEAFKKRLESLRASSNNSPICHDLHLPPRCNLPIISDENSISSMTCEPANRVRHNHGPTSSTWGECSSTRPILSRTPTVNSSAGTSIYVTVPSNVSDNQSVDASSMVVEPSERYMELRSERAVSENPSVQSNSVVSRNTKPYLPLPPASMVVEPSETPSVGYATTTATFSEAVEPLIGSAFQDSVEVRGFLDLDQPQTTRVLPEFAIDPYSPLIGHSFREPVRPTLRKVRYRDDALQNLSRLAPLSIGSPILDPAIANSQLDITAFDTSSVSVQASSVSARPNLLNGGSTARSTRLVGEQRRSSAYELPPIYDSTRELHGQFFIDLLAQYPVRGGSEVDSTASTAGATSGSTNAGNLYD
ncbi:hypothetical protein EDC01DRAFT_626577 [Geopyxis carbonaria]|nr:hypothetical protein EDC01DRAFT_626577 [Geopyxis carbonaria]